MLLNTNCSGALWTSSLEEYICSCWTRELGKLLGSASVRGSSCFASSSPVFSGGQSQDSHWSTALHCNPSCSVTMPSDGVWKCLPGEQCSEVDV